MTAVGSGLEVLPVPEWRDPPEALRGGEAQYTVRLAPARRLLRVNRGKWAMVARSRTSHGAAKLATNIRAARYGFKATEVWEATSRMLDDDSGWYGVFVRYLGADEDEAPAPSVVNAAAAGGGQNGNEVGGDGAGEHDVTDEPVGPALPADDAAKSPPDEPDESPERPEPRDDPSPQPGRPPRGVHVGSCGSVGPRGKPCRHDAGHPPPHAGGWARGSHTWTDDDITTPERVEVDPAVELPPSRTGPDAIEHGPTWPTPLSELAKAAGGLWPSVLVPRTERHEPEPSVAVCCCGHAPRAHDPDDGACNIGTCDCSGLALATAL